MLLIFALPGKPSILISVNGYTVLYSANTKLALLSPTPLPAVSLVLLVTAVQSEISWTQKAAFLSILFEDFPNIYIDWSFGFVLLRGVCSVH